MTQEELLREFSTLPPDAQKQVVDFIAFLRDRQRSSRRKIGAKRTRGLAEEDFIGIWQDRKDMSDSRGWVRKIRSDEWGTG